MTRRPVAAGILVLAAFVTVSACGRPGDASSPTQTGPSTTIAPTSTTTPSTTPSATEPSTPASGAARTITVTIRGRQVTPAPARVELERGQTLRLVVTSDHDDELHAHGFDVESALRAGVPTSIDLTGDEPGLYDVETHHPELRLLQVLVR